MITSQITPATVPMFLNELTQKLPLPLTSFKVVNQSLAVLSSYQDGDILRQYGDGKIFKDEHAVNLFRSKVSTEGLRAILLTALVYQYSEKVINQNLIDLKANIRAVMKKKRGLDRMIQDYSVSFWTRNQGNRLREIRDEVKTYIRQFKELKENEVTTSEDEEQVATPLTPHATPEEMYVFRSTPTISLTPELLRQKIKEMHIVSTEDEEKKTPTVRLVRRKSETHLDELHASLIQEKKALEASVLAKPALPRGIVLTQEQLNKQLAKMGITTIDGEDKKPATVQATPKKSVTGLNDRVKHLMPIVPRKDFKEALLTSFAKFKPAIERANDGVFVMDRDEKEWEQLPPGQFEDLEPFPLRPTGNPEPFLPRPPVVRTVSEYEFGKTPVVRTPRQGKEEISHEVITELSNFLKQPLLMLRKSVKPPKEKKDTKNKKEGARIG